MKLLIINTDYQEFIDNEYAQNPNLANESFKKQLQHRYDTLFGNSNFYSLNLNNLGHSATDLFINNEYIQRQWAKENKFNPDSDTRRWLKTKPIGSGWMERILAAQIASYKPDHLYTMAMEAMRPEFLQQLKSRFKSLKIIGQHAAPLTQNMQDLSGYDLILSSLPNQVAHFKKLGARSCLFRLAFESTILDILPPTKKTYGAVHIGGYGPVHNERNEVLEKLAAKVLVDFWGYGESNLKPNSPILKKFHGFIGGKQMYEVLNQSQLTMTKHIKSVAATHANNMTLYEATGVGTLLLVDERSDLKEIFEPGEEVVTYKDAKELIEKTRHYLENPDDAAVIAFAGQARTLKDHTYYQRAKEMIAILEEL